MFKSVYQHEEVISTLVYGLLVDVVAFDAVQVDTTLRPGSGYTAVIFCQGIVDIRGATESFLTPPVNVDGMGGDLQWAIKRISPMVAQAEQTVELQS